MVTLTGDGGNNSLTGGADDDSISGLAGNDTLTGAAGNDSIFGGTGNDSIFGGTGDDSLDGGDDRDTIFGGDNNDTLFGGAGNDVLDGGTGDDSIDGGDGDDIIAGGTGNDTIDGNTGNDNITGDAGTDSISGGAGNDAIFGGADNDTLSGGGDDDSIQGDDGNDVISGDAGNDTLSGGTGTDTISGGDGNDLIRGEADADDLSGDAGNDTIFGGAGSDVIDGGAGLDVIDGGAGNDTITGGADTDQIVGGAGDDRIDGGDGNDIISGDSGVNEPTFTRQSFEWDKLTSGGAPIASGDSITSGSVQNTDLVNVTVTNTPGSQFTGFTYDGATTQQVGGINSGVELIDNTSAGRLAGTGVGQTSTTEFSFAAAGVNVQSEVQNVQFRVNDIDDDDWLDVVSIRAFNANGQAVPITLTAGSALTLSNNDTVAGNDTASIANGGGSGNSADAQFSVLVTIAGPISRFEISYSNLEAGPQIIDITDIFFDAVRVAPNTVEGNDSITGGAGIDQLFGQGGNDTIDGGDDADLIDGGIGNDSLIGGAGGDFIFGGAGLDTIDGGDDNDFLDGGAERDNITGGSGNDTIFGQAGNDVIDGGIGDDNIDGGSGNDNIQGGADNDTIQGGIGNDTIDGGTGNDSLLGGTGNDSILGNDGNDSIQGNDGADTISGGAGTDSVDGGAGADSIDGGADNDSLSGGADNDTITGGTGSDTLDGGAGNDALFGGDENDTILASTGTDNVQGGAGTDTYTVPGSSTIANDTETITVTVDENGSGTVVKTVNATTDTLGGVENFIADEAVAENDRLIYTTIVTDEGTITGLAGATGTFTDKNGNVVNFGGGGEPTFSDVLAQVRTGQFIANGGSLTGTVGNIAFTDFETVTFNVVCFTRETLIETQQGPVAIESLKPGDLVHTADHGLQPVRWIGARKFGAEELAANPHLRPITIPAGSFGTDRDLTISPQHRMLVKSLRNDLLFGTPEVLIKAKDLLGRAGVRVSEQTEVEYFHILFDDHEIVFANGAPSESLHPGMEALDTLSAESRDEVYAIFPELKDNPLSARRLARYALKSYEARAVAA